MNKRNKNGASKRGRRFKNHCESLFHQRYVEKQREREDTSILT